jgi:hypothetical protein
MAMDQKEYQKLLTAVNKMSSRQKTDFVKALGLTDTSAATGGKLKAGAAAQLGKLGDSANDLAKAALLAATNMSELESPAAAVYKQISLLRQEQENLFQAGFSKEMFDFSKSMQAAARESYNLTGNYKAFADAQNALRSGFKGLGFVLPEFRKSLLETGVALSAAGFDMRDYAGIVDSAVHSFDMSERQIKDLSATLIKTSREFAIAPKELTENFQFAQKNFAYNTERFMDNFLRLQKMSRVTGVDFKTLAGSFGDSMDTFEGSAQMAGRLNQILGKSVFSSIDLLGKTEAERAEIIRKGIQQRFGGRIDQLKKFELKAIAAQLRMSPEEARRFLRGETPKALEDKRKLELLKQDPVKMASANLGNELKNLKKGIEGFRMPFEKNMIKLNSKALMAVDGMDAFANGIFNAGKKFSSVLAGEKSETIGGRRVTTEGFGEVAKPGAGAVAASAAAYLALNKLLNDEGIVANLTGGLLATALATKANKMVSDAINNYKRESPFADPFSGQQTQPAARIAPKPAKIDPQSQKGIGQAVASALDGINISLVVPGPLGGVSPGAQAPPSIVGKLQIEDFNQGSQQAD